MKQLCMLASPVLLLGAYLTTVRAAEETKAKELIWGWGFNGVAISVNPEKSRYRMGEEIQVLVTIRNLGEEEVMVVSTGGFIRNYRLALFDMKGWPAGKTKRMEEVEPYLARRPEIPVSSGGTRLKPGEMFEHFQAFSLNEWIKIEKEGTYFLVVMRHLRSWDKGFMISNAAKIVITNGENQLSPDERSTPSENSTLGQDDRLEAGKYLIGGLCALLIVGLIALLKKVSSRSKSSP